MERIQQQIRQIEQLSPHYRAFAMRIAHLAEQFDDEAIRDLVQQYMVAV
jgi:hypothetical protein